MPWIKSATVLENIIFGKKYDEERFWQVIRACSLEQDLAILPQGEHTDIGEKGITLSGRCSSVLQKLNHCSNMITGGQKVGKLLILCLLHLIVNLQARISLARAVYSQAEIVLLDDPLSAVDAYVGRSIMENCLLSGPLATRTRILVTHILHVLDRTHYIYVVDNGRVIEQGSYHVCSLCPSFSLTSHSRFHLQQNLLSDNAVFRQLIDEHLGRDPEKRGVPNQGAADHSGEGHPEAKKSPNTEKFELMEEEERNIGAVSSDVYKKYLRNAGGLFWVPVILSLLLLNEAANGMFSSENFHWLISLLSVDYTVPWFLDRKFNTAFQKWSLYGSLCRHWSVSISCFLLSLVDS